MKRIVCTVDSTSLNGANGETCSNYKVGVCIRCPYKAASGKCSDTSKTTKAACESAKKTWTDMVEGGHDHIQTGKAFKGFGHQVPCEEPGIGGQRTTNCGTKTCTKSQSTTCSINSDCNPDKGICKMTNVPNPKGTCIIDEKAKAIN